MILLAAYQALLYRYTGQQDVIVGTFTANRNRAEMSNTIGFYQPAGAPLSSGGESSFRKFDRTNTPNLGNG